MVCTRLRFCVSRIQRTARAHVFTELAVTLENMCIAFGINPLFKLVLFFSCHCMRDMPALWHNFLRTLAVFSSSQHTALATTTTTHDFISEFIFLSRLGVFRVHSVFSFSTSIWLTFYVQIVCSKILDVTSNYISHLHNTQHTARTHTRRIVACVAFIALVVVVEKQYRVVLSICIEPNAYTLLRWSWCGTRLMRNIIGW